VNRLDGVPYYDVRSEAFCKVNWAISFAWISPSHCVRECTPGTLPGRSHRRFREHRKAPIVIRMHDHPCRSSCSWLCDLALLGELGELGVSLEPRFPPVVSDLLGDCRSARAAEGLKGQHAVPAGLYARSHGTGWGGEGQGEEGESLDRGKLGQAWVAAGSVKMRRHARFQRHGMHPSTRP